MITYLAAIAAGGAGAVARFLVDRVISRTERFPRATFVINVAGSFLLGLLIGVTVSDSAARLIIGSGFLGGFTTFSTASVETVRLVQGGHGREAIGYSLGTLLVSVCAAWIGLTIGA